MKLLIIAVLWSLVWPPATKRNCYGIAGSSVDVTGPKPKRFSRVIGSLSTIFIYMQRSASVSRLVHRSGGLKFGQWGLLIFIIASYFVVFFRQLQSGLEFDEAINLTVVKNLALGNGYATNLLPTSENQFHLFDPFVSTGPTMLAPSALIWGITDGNLALTRIIPLAFFVLYLVFVFLLLKRLWGVAAASIGLAMPLLLNVGGPDLTTHGLSVGRFIGEFAVVALSYLGVYLLTRRSYLLAALVLGFAGLTKLNWLLVSLTILFSWFAFMFVKDRRLRVTTWVSSLFFLLLPLATFEIYKFGVLGASGYTKSFEDYRAWLDVQGQGSINRYLNDGGISLPDRIIAIVQEPSNKIRILDLFGLISFSGLLLLMVGLLLLTMIALQSRKMEFCPSDYSALRLPVAVTLMIAGLVSIGWWLLFMAQGSARIGLPFWLLVGPLIGVAVYRAIKSIVGEGGVKHRIRWVFQISLTCVLVGSLAVQLWTLIVDSSRSDLFKEQTIGAQLLVDSGAKVLPRSGFWTYPELQVFTDLPTSDQQPGQPQNIKVFSSVQALLERGNADATVYIDECSGVLYQSQSLLICRQ